MKISDERIRMIRRTTPHQEHQYRQVAFLIEKACTNTQIAKKLKVDLVKTHQLVNAVIERWADRIGEENEMLAVREAQLMAIARRCLIDFDKRLQEVTITYVQCKECLGRGYKEGYEGDCSKCGYDFSKGECDGKCECQVCEGKGEVKVERKVKTTKADLQLLVIAQRSIIESAKLRGLYIQRKDTRTDQMERMGGDLHQHVHIEGRPFEHTPSDELEAARKMLDQLMQREQVIIEGGVEEESDG